MKPPIKRCAIYTRKSSEEGLEQEFNSLHAQREACESFILSQKHEGWTKIKTCYDDGGYSGGSINRPALQELMDDIKAGKIDSVVVYKIDRLTRSLMDFAKLVEIFDQHKVTFVSVTQSFNTTTSMGRLTLNVLLSFAQFEREVTGERIRDKIAASKKKGMWMGGAVPLGYDAVERHLIINKRESEKVQLIFGTYLRLGTVRELKKYLDAHRVVSARRVSSKGNVSGEVPFSRGNLYKILSNHLYAGRIDHKGQIHEGLHEGIIDTETWQTVQEKLKSGSVQQVGSSNTKRGNNSLRRKLFDPDGVIYTPTYTKKNSRQYRYYLSQNLLQYKDQPKGQIARIPAEEIEKKITTIIKGKLTIPESFINFYPEIDQNTAAHLVNYFNKTNDSELLRFVQKVVISPDNLNVTIDTGHITNIILEDLSITLPEIDPEQATFSVPYRTTRGENGMIIIQPEDKSRSQLDLPTNTLKKLVQGVIWREKYFNGMTLEQLAKTNNCSWTHVSNCIDLSFHF